MRSRRFACALLLAALGLAPAASALAQNTSGTAPGLHSGVGLSENTPLAQAPQVLRRMLSPLALEQIRQDLARSGKELGGDIIDLAGERFALYVPSGAPPAAGYALLVFVPPWEDARLPEGWAAVLDRHAVLYVSAARSGNTANVLGRRVPLALLAEANIVKRYAVDPERIFIGGFSGGARVALRIALGYPDVFRGALLNAGSDPIGVKTDPLPPRDLLQLFQSSMHLVYLSGENDTASEADGSSARSMRSWCVSNLDMLVTPHAAHQVADAHALDRALSRLLQPAANDLKSGSLENCRTALDAGLNRQLGQVESRIAAGQGSQARSLLLQIDTRFGGLSAPRAVELAQRCNCSVFTP